MEEIKVGEYVRTKNGKIRKIESTVAQYYITDKLFIMEDNQYELKDIVNHSFNIIDLIEEGDYVNGRLVLQVDYKNKNVCLLIPFTDTKANINIIWYGYEDIKSIVTKEQFKNIEYKV